MQIHRPLLPLLLAALLLAVPALAQVIEEEELDDLQAGPALGESVTDADLTTLFRAAEGQFLAQDAAAALGSFNRLLEHFESRRLAGQLNEELRRLTVLSLTYRARLHFAYGDEAALEADLGRILELVPETELDPGLVEPEIAARFDGLRKARIGTLLVTADPPDLKLKVDGREIALMRPVAAFQETPADGTAPAPPTTSIPLLAGVRLVEASRLGYAPFVTELEVRAGAESRVGVVLERTSAVLRLHTRPAGAEVVVDGVVRGVTEGQAEPGTIPSGGRYRLEEFSAELVLDGIEPGLRILEVRHPGYRSYRGELQIRGLVDEELPPIVLESERGTLILSNFPAGATVRVDGQPVRMENPGPSPRIHLTPGEHRIQVAQGPTRMYSSTINVADRQTVDVTVRLQPGLAFLGVLGGDRGRAEDLGRALRLALVESGRWSLLDRREAAVPVLAGAGVDAAAARRAAAGDGNAVDWRALQAAADKNVPGLLYLVGVLSDDLLATHADLWVFTAAPGPARPARVRVELGLQAETKRFAEALRPSLPLRRASLGAQVITSDAAPHPIIASLTPDGPLAAAGAQVGDMLVAVARVPVFTGSDVEVRLLAAESGEPMDVGIQTAEGARNLRVTLGSSPLIHAAGIRGALDPIAFTELQLMAEGARPDALWAIGLNQALILMRANDWSGAVRLLRDLRAPSGSGVGTGTIDYYMGLALANAGTRYRDNAIEILRRAAANDGARLLHDDGPYVAPRARARLLAMGAP